MLANLSPRGSFSVPVHINLHNVRQRRTRDLLQYPISAQESQWRRGRAGEKVKAQVPGSSVGEERALLLGYTMMAFSILMYFVVGITVVKPCYHSDWEEAANCSLVTVELLNEDDWRGLSTNPCLQVTVNITTVGTTVRLHYDEVVMNLSPECFYTPKIQQNEAELTEEVQKVRDFMLSLKGQAVQCHPSKGRHPDDAILKKRFTLHKALRCLLWPSLMLIGGGMLVGMIRLIQCLAHLCNEITAREEGDGDLTTPTQGKLYQLLRCRSPRSEGQAWESQE